MLTWTGAKRRVLSELKEDVDARTNAIYATLAPEILPPGVNREQLERELALWARVTYGLDAVALDNLATARDLAPLWGWLKRLILRRMVRALAISNEAHHAFRRTSYVEQHPYPETTHDLLYYRYLQLKSGGKKPLQNFARRIFEDEDGVSDQPVPPRVVSSTAADT